MTDNTNNHNANSPWLWVMNIGLLLVMAGTAMPLLLMEGNAFQYIYATGAVATLIGSILMPKYKGPTLRIKRLARMQIWSGIFFCAGAFFMYYYDRSRMDWLAFTLAGAIIMVYTNIMISRLLKKEK